ncbi:MULTISPECIES: Eco57I restriction-modification methylase domain-containing protein, partial [unclassified Bradyrhizobium]
RSSQPRGFGKRKTLAKNGPVFRPQITAKISIKSFDAVVGNPPWTFDSRRTMAPRKKDDDGTARPRRSPDQLFLSVAAKLAGENGRIGMIMKASPFFSKDEHAVLSRNSLIKRLQPVAIMNLSALRKEELFPDATGPALLFFSRCALTQGKDQMLVGSFPWTPDFKRNGMFQLGPGEMRSVPIARVLRTPAFLKAATFGTVRDGWLIDRLENEFPTLEEVLIGAGLSPSYSRGQGFQVEGDDNQPPRSFYKLKVLTPKEYTPFRVQRDQLERLQHETLHRPRDPAIYKGPLVVCPKANLKAAAQLGRYGAAVSDADLLYTESFYGISFYERNENLAFALSAILNSSITTFQLALGGGAWGLERSTVEPKDLLSVRVPNFFGRGVKLSPLVKAERLAASNPSEENLATLDAAVADLYELEPEESVLANESIERARMLIFEGRPERQRFTRPPSPLGLKGYSAAVVSAINNYLRVGGQRHLQATIFRRAVSIADWDAGSSGLLAVRFTMQPGRASAEPIVNISSENELNGLGNFLLSKLQTDIAPYINERRLLRIYLGDDLFIVKPNEVRYWTQTNGLNDADVILADHWAGGVDAAHA